MRCLILGASGFLGRHVYTALCADPRLEVHTAGRRAAHADLWLDLTRAGAAAVAEVLRVAAPAVVVNCVGAVAGDPAGLAAGNVVSVAALLDGIGRLPYPPRLVHVGCAAEYRPVDAYATTKLAGTELLL